MSTFAIIPSPYLCALENGDLSPGLPPLRMRDSCVIAPLGRRWQCIGSGRRCAGLPPRSALRAERGKCCPLWARNASLRAQEAGSGARPQS